MKNENMTNQLMDYFIMADFMVCNEWLPIDPRRQAMTDYQTNPAIQGRVNSIVGDILKIVEDNDDGLHTKEN